MKKNSREFRESQSLRKKKYSGRAYSELLDKPYKEKCWDEAAKIMELSCKNVKGAQGKRTKDAEHSDDGSR